MKQGTNLNGSQFYLVAGGGEHNKTQITTLNIITPVKYPTYNITTRGYRKITPKEGCPRFQFTG